ncbi:MAG: F0F1 ATP synthase subunit delta [Lachnospiraceae bacterium]|nr:F0F1 ATP synthase subunit delta [Lachnospiraceae bacterium]
MAKVIAKVYGDALFDLAFEENKVDEISSQIDVISQSLKDEPDLKKLLTHPMIAKEEKQAIIENIFKGRADDDIVGFFREIAEKERFKNIEDIISYFQDRVREYKKIGVAYVSSAVTLSEKQKKQIEQKLVNQTPYDSFIMNYSVDPSLIGGLVVRIGDRVADSSVKTKIYNMTRNLRNVSLE